MAIRFDEVEVSDEMLSVYRDLRMGSVGRRDDNETMMLARQLEYVKARVYEKLYPQFKARELIPMATDTPPAANEIRYRIWDSWGVAKLIDHYATDLPNVGAYAREMTSPVKGIGSSYGYSVQDVRSAAYAGVALDARLAMAAKRAIEHVIDEVAAKGLPSVGFPGLTNNPAVNVVPPRFGDWANPSRTGLEILTDLSLLVSDIVTFSKGVHTPNTVVLPLGLYELVSSKVVGANLDRTVLSVFLERNPHITQVEAWYHLDTASPTGDNRIICYEKSDEILELEVPLEFEQLSPQEDGLMINVPCHGRIGGCVVHFPMALRYMDDC